MIIGVKYCGGCNPRFDRADIVKRLGEAFPRHKIRFGAGETPPDLALIVCGCPSQCASHVTFTGKHGKMVLYSPEQYEDLRLLISNIDKE